MNGFYLEPRRRSVIPTTDYSDPGNGDNVDEDINMLAFFDLLTTVRGKFFALPFSKKNEICRIEAEELKGSSETVYLGEKKIFFLCEFLLDSSVKEHAGEAKFIVRTSRAA